MLCRSPCCLFLSPCKAHGVPWLLLTPHSALILALASPVRHSGIVLMMLTTLVGKHSSWQQLQAPCLLLLNSTNEINLLSASVPLQPHSRALIIPVFFLKEAIPSRCAREMCRSTKMFNFSSGYGLPHCPRKPFA